MNKQSEIFIKILVYIAILANIMFIIWITYNGIDEGFSGNIIQVISYICLVFLLILNIILILIKRKR